MYSESKLLIVLCIEDPHWPSVITNRGWMYSWKHLKSNLHHPVICLVPITFHVDKINSKWNKGFEKRRVGEKKTADDFVFISSGNVWVPDVWVPAYLCVRSTCKAPVVPIVTGCVLEAEARFVAFSHSSLCAGIKQVVVAEFIHAVVMSNVPHNKDTPVSGMYRKQWGH